MRLLLLSNSTNFGSGYLDHAEAEVRELFSGVKRLAFVPFALFDKAAYAAKARQRFARFGIDVAGVSADSYGLEALESADGVFVGGGNSFRLLDVLQRSGVLGVLRRRVQGGMPYMGASAGSNIAAPTIKTTNDMPIVQPASFDALGFVPFQINPHYIDSDVATRHMGETRDDRLREYLEENQTPVMGLREGAWLRREGASLRLGGTRGAKLFQRGQQPEELAAGSSLDGLLAPS